MSIRQKWLISVLSVTVSSSIILGCTNSSNKNITVVSNNNQESNQSQLGTDSSVIKKESNQSELETPSNEIKRESLSNSSLITKGGGLGDTKETIEQLHGKDESKENSAFSIYDNRTFLVLYVLDELYSYQNYASNITLEFEATDKPRRTKLESLTEVAQIIPNDAIKIKEYASDESRDVIQYESKILAERYKDYYDFAASLDNDMNPGTFIVVLKHDDQGIFTVVVGTGDNP